MMARVAGILCMMMVLSFSGRAQVQDSVTQSSKKWHQTKFVKTAGVPIVLTGLGLVAANERTPINRFKVRDGITGEFPNFSSTVDDYLRYVPPASVYALDLLGVKSKNSFKHRTLIFLKANIIGFAVAFPLKGITQVRRPDNSSSASFPSLHTTQAFIGATFMHKELGHRSIWYSVGAYTIATATGFYRILNNKHWLSDVMVGAALGILSTNVAYLTHQFKEPRKKRKSNNVSALFSPILGNNTYGASMTLLLN